MIETIISNFHLEKIMYIIKKRLAWMILLGALCSMAGGAYAYMTGTTIYRAKISFYVYSNPDYVYDSSVNISNTDFTTAKNLVKSYTLIMKSQTVLDKVIKDTGITGYSAASLASHIYTAEESGTAVFYVYVDDSNPVNAMTIANALGEIAPNEISRIVKSGGIEVIDYATLPTDPITSTNILKLAVLGFVGGFGLMLVVALFFGLLDTTIRRRYELRLTFKIPVLGDVPQITAPNKKTKVSTVLTEESPFAVKECYNLIRTNMLYTGKGQKCPVYAITSASQHEGKTMNSINLAISYAQLEKKVLLIDCDMRKSSVSKSLGLQEGKGLSDYLAGLVAVPGKVEYAPNLTIITAGTVPPNPAELIASERMDKLLNSSREEYDCIILDLPPIGIVTDALLLAKKVTGYIMIIKAFQSKMHEEKSAVAMLEQVDAEISGFIFNGMNPKSQDYAYKSYNYNYYYGNDNDTKKKGKR